MDRLVCRPSLVSLLTGLYPHQHGVQFNHGLPESARYSRMISADAYVKTRQREFELIREQKHYPEATRPDPAAKAVF